ncbi:tRNA dihydrouridine synthase DusB [Pararhizobium haloflavum]|uniref:tRNA dihydrouridine synthase DusB n=1 Tax=Pararhizobium haloflavum TaxID=2037914 RepID=UPI000C17F019|nr:tRNA dihydrouridine synthase DusB [Pararhizobium haloflavum]
MHSTLTDLSRPLRVGGVTLPNRVALAPMSGVSDLPFRQLAHRFGAGMVVTEMIASRELVGSSADSVRRMRRDAGFVHIVQLAGREAGWMAEAARIAEGEGADIVDINMGCPAKRVTGGYSGSALMRDPDHALGLVEATVGAVDIPVTLKMRLGWDDNSINAPMIAARAENAGVALVTVHGRTRCQFYEGRADWHAIRAVKDVLSVPLVANGDIESIADCRAIVEASGADAVMVGRAAQGRPWLPGALAGSTNHPTQPAAILSIVLEHYDMILSHYGAALGVRQARKHLAAYMALHAPVAPEALRRKVMTSPDAGAVSEALQSIFNDYAMPEAA